MSQSATLYSVNPDKFNEIEKANGKRVKPHELSDEYTTFQGSFMALEFILSKGRDQAAQKLIEEIFDPQADIGATDMSTVDFEAIEEEELWSLVDCVAYLSTEKVQAINDLLAATTVEEVSNAYNAQELNANGIYPQIWHNNTDNHAFNKRHVVEDFTELKAFFKKAAASRNYILSYVG